MHFQKYVFTEPYWGWMVEGVGNTLLVSFTSGLLALLLGIALALGTVGGNKSGKKLATIFTGVFRNIPPVPLLLFLSFGLPHFWRSVSGGTFPSGMEFHMLVAGLALNTSAYVCEILRSGIRSVPIAQIEAGHALGIGRFTIGLRIVLPQALRVSAPALATRLIHNMKNSSVALVLPLDLNRMELMGQSSRIAGQTFAWAEPLVFSAAVYLILSVLLSLLFNGYASRCQSKVHIL